MLGELVNKWAPRAFTVSFKLETDQRILVHKVGGGGGRMGASAGEWGRGREALQPDHFCRLPPVPI